MSLSKTSTRTSAKTGKKKHGGLFTKIKGIFGPSSSSSSTIAKTKTREDDRDSLGTVATRTRSRISMFGTRRESKDFKDPDRELEERKSRCLAIQAAKRDPPAVQRLLVDCEFCNPPPHFGRTISIKSAGLTTKDAEKNFKEIQALRASGADLSDEREWNQGLDEWIKMRDWWLTPTVYQQPIHHLDSDLTPDRYYTVFDKMIYQTRPLKHPLNLSDITKILKSGWVGEGSWPDIDDNDVWSTSDAEDLQREKQKTQTETNGSEQKKLDTNNIENGEPKIEISFASPSSSTTPSQEYIRNTNSRESDSVASEALHVQFRDSPHPRESGPLKPAMAPLERVTSSLGPPLRPVRSSQSSVVSITDSD